MTRVYSDEKHDYYINSSGGMNGEIELFNIVPKGSQVPPGGYYNLGYIEKIKGVKFPEWVLEHIIGEVRQVAANSI